MLQGLCGYLNSTELFNRGYDREANLTTGNEKEDTPKCMTISCDESQFEVAEICELRTEIWNYTKKDLGKKCRFRFSRVEINHGPS